MSGHTDLSSVIGLCYYCNNEKKCKIYRKWIESEFVGARDIDVLFNVLRCKNYLPNNYINKDLFNYPEELAYRQKKDFC